MDICFSIDSIQIHVLSIIFERLTRILPSHSHGSGCYEIHFIPFGYGKLTANGQDFDLSPNTLYITGPHIEHTQASILSNPMQEYCIYLKIHHTSKRLPSSAIMDIFTSTPFWIGKDTQDVHALLKQLFYELEHRYTGYQNQITMLLSQLLIHIVRNYEYQPIPHDFPSRHNPAESTSVIIEEYFLYEYQSLSLSALAEKLNLSTRQTQRLLVAYYGKTFQQKKAEARMSAAAVFLADKSKSITSVAEDLGYSSIEHFSSSFKSYYHMTPREYRKQFLP